MVRVAGVPLLGLSLSAALGALDALVAYGVFAAQDPIALPAEDEREGRIG